MVLSENTSTHVGLNGVVEIGRKMTKRWVEIINPEKKEEPEEDTRSCEEIVSGIWARAGVR